MRFAICGVASILIVGVDVWKCALGHLGFHTENFTLKIFMLLTPPSLYPEVQPEMFLRAAFFVC